MSDPKQRNIVILGASFAGVSMAHYVLKFLLPALTAKNDDTYHVYLINPSSDFYFRTASARSSASLERLPAEKVLYDLPTIFAKYGNKDFTFIQGTATGLDTTARSVHYKSPLSNSENALSYHALIVATGSRTGDPVFSMHPDTDTPALLALTKQRNADIASAKSIIVSGGGPTGVETAGEIGEMFNGRPGWFSWFSKPKRNIEITLVTASDRLLPATRPSIGQTAEKHLKKLGVAVLYNTRVVPAVKTESGKTAVTFTSSKTGDQHREVDLYIAAHGVLPNTEWLPRNLVAENGGLKTNAQTLRVDEAGARVYAIGDVASFSKWTIPEIMDSIPVLGVNLKRDLLSYSPEYPNEKPKGQDRHLKQHTQAIQVVPIGSGGGVGEAFGWTLPSFLIWLAKARDMMVSMAPPTFNGNRVSEVKLKKEEAF